MGKRRTVCSVYSAYSIPVYLVYAASQHAAYQYGPDRGGNQDEDPVVSGKVLVDHHRVGGQGERREGAPGGVVNRVRDGSRPHAAGVDPQVAEDEACGHDGADEQRQHDQPVARGVVEGGEEDQGRVPGGVDEPDQHQGPPPAQRQELGEQVAPHPDLLPEGERERQYGHVHEEADRGVGETTLGQDEGGKRGGPHDDGRGKAHEEGDPECDPPHAQARAVEAQRLPAFLGVALPGDHEQHDHRRHDEAAPTARTSTSTEKTAPLVVSVILVNTLRTSSVSYVRDLLPGNRRLREGLSGSFYGLPPALASRARQA